MERRYRHLIEIENFLYNTSNHFFSIELIDCMFERLFERNLTFIASLIRIILKHIFLHNYFLDYIK